MQKVVGPDLIVENKIEKVSQNIIPSCISGSFFTPSGKKAPTGRKAPIGKKVLRIKKKKSKEQL